MHRLRTFILITGTLLCVLIAAAFVVSGWWVLVLQIPTQYGPAVAVSGGLGGVILDDMWSAVILAERTGTGLTPHWRWWNAWEVNWRYIHLPLYAVFAAVAVPTLLVWRFWPKPVRPGNCRCGYDLRGNESGVCPECGVEVQA
jgi:hypothetical protein